MSDYSDTRIQFRRGTAAEWSAANPVLGVGEPGYDTTSDILKVGDGITVWSSLSGISGGGITQEDLDNAISNIVDTAPETLDTLNELAAAINDNPNFFNEVAYSGGDISQFNNNQNYIVSDNSVAAGSDTINNIVNLSQAEYDAITPSTGVLYVIEDAPDPITSLPSSGNWDVAYSWVASNSGVVVSSGDSISFLLNDANYVASGDNISLFNNDANYVESDTTGITGASGLNNIVQISQSDYNAIGSGNYDLNTAYFITDAPEINYVASGDNVSIFANDANYVASGDNVSVLTNDANYVASGDNVSKLNNDVGYLTSHPSISAATSSENSGRTYIQDILLDSNGHVLGLSTATETVVDTNTDTNNYVTGGSYSAGTLTLNRLGLSNITIGGFSTDGGGTVTNIGVNNTNYTDGNINFVGGGATSISKVGNTVTITSTDTDTNTDTNNYVSSTSFSNIGNTLTLNRQGLSALTQAIGTDASPFGSIKLAGAKISSSQSAALYLNRTHANGLTAMAGGTYPDANDGGLVATYGSSHSFSPGQAHMYYNSSTIRLLADTNGVTVYGTFTNNSDATQKENVVPLSGCLDLVKNLNPVSFNFKPEEGLHNRTTVGFIAQEVQQIFSGLPYELGIVREIDYNTLSSSGEMNQKQILGISETNLIAVLTKAVQELTARVEALENRA